MTSAEMLARVRTNLDEATASFWSDNEIYRALADGQREIISHIFIVWKQKVRVNPEEPLPEVLRSLISSDSGTTTKSLPNDFMSYLTVYSATNAVPIFVRENWRQNSWMRGNTYSTSTSAQPFCYFNATQIVFETAVAWTMEYLKAPSDISGSTQPSLPTIAHNAVVQFAFATLLLKDSNPIANQELQKFFLLLQNLY